MGALVLGTDPLLSGGIGLDELLVVALKVLVAFAGLLVSVILMVWFERKIIADMQNRFGPNRAGPFGLFQTVADGMKLILIPFGPHAPLTREVYRLFVVTSH